MNCISILVSHNLYFNVRGIFDTPFNINSATPKGAFRLATRLGESFEKRRGFPDYSDTHSTAAYARVRSAIVPRRSTGSARRASG